MRRTVLGLAAAAVLAAAAPAAPATAAPPAARTDACERAAAAIRVPGAEAQRAACLPDLTTAGLAQGVHTDAADWAVLHDPRTVNPSGVPGVQVDGCFPDTSATNTNTTGPCRHDAQFVIRLPHDWNGGLVVTGAPGVREQYANDRVISDWVLAEGYAFVSTDKGNTGAAFYTDGARPGDAIAEWHHRVTQLARAARRVVQRHYGERPDRTYMTGLSNGGYLTRWQLENRPALYDGGVDWEGVLWTPETNLLTMLPPALRAFPEFRDTGSEHARQQVVEAGFAEGSEFLWQLHYDVYWDLTQRIYREELDPSYDGALLAGVPKCAPGTPHCDADYDLAARPQAVRDAIRRISLTGALKRPMLTVHGTLDSLTPLGPNTELYAEMVAEKGRGRNHRVYVIEGGQHVDGFVPAFPGQLRPILPCYRDAFTRLEQWVEEGVAPPASGYVSKPSTGDLVNTCDLATAH